MLVQFPGKRLLHDLNELLLLLRCELLVEIVAQTKAVDRRVLDHRAHLTIVYSRREVRPANATRENGVGWIEWSPRGEGIPGPGNRTDFGMLMLRIMATNPQWTERPDNVTEPGMGERVMGPYYPRGEYTDKATFEAKGPKRS